MGEMSPTRRVARSPANAPETAVRDLKLAHYPIFTTGTPTVFAFHGYP
jgi:hypothetical protein